MTTRSGTISSEELAVWRMLQRAQVIIARQLETDLMAAHDLALASYDVLTQLSESPERRLRMNDLADRVLLSRSGLTRLIDRLQREGLVEREACESDARGLFAVLTKRGYQRYLEATPTYLRGVQEHVLNLMEPEEIAQSHAMLTRLFGPAEAPSTAA